MRIPGMAAVVLLGACAGETATVPTDDLTLSRGGAGASRT